MCCKESRYVLVILVLQPTTHTICSSNVFETLLKKDPGNGAYQSKIDVLRAKMSESKNG